MKAAKTKLKPSTSAQYRMSMETHFSDWLDTPARSITSSMIEARHIAIGTGKTDQTYATPQGGQRKGQRGGKGAADLAMRVLRAVYSYGCAVLEDTILRNPVAVLSKTDSWFRLERRDTFISSDKLKPWFEAINSLGDGGTKTLLLLGMFTGARKGELASLKWSDLDLEKGTVLFRITKNGKMLLVPLAGYMIDVLTRYHADFYTGPDGWVFPSHGPTGHLKDPRGTLAQVAEQSGVTFMMHDFRRGFLSYATAKGIPSFTQKRLVNHALPSDVTQGYIQFEMPVLRAAVELIAAYILTNAGISTEPTPGGDSDHAEKSEQETKGNVVSMDEHRARKAA